MANCMYLYVWMNYVPLSLGRYMYSFSSSFLMIFSPRGLWLDHFCCRFSFLSVVCNSW